MDRHIRPAADFLVAHGPSFGVERWEEQSGYSPSTIAAEIAGLTAARPSPPATATRLAPALPGHRRRLPAQHQGLDGDHHRPGRARATSSGCPRPATRTPPSATASATAARPWTSARSSTAASRNWSGSASCPATDPDVQASLTVLDKQISVTTPSGTGYYRYGNRPPPGSADGYGDCYQPSQTSCTATGAPWPPTGIGTGHLWPVLSGERAESDLAAGQPPRRAGPASAMLSITSGVGLVPEQAWEDPDLPASPYGSDPTTASIGFTHGKPAGSASPADLGAGPGGAADRSTWAPAPSRRPAVTTARYVTHGPPGALPRHHDRSGPGARWRGTTTRDRHDRARRGGRRRVGRHHDRRPRPRSPRTTAGADGDVLGHRAGRLRQPRRSPWPPPRPAAGTGYAQVTVTDEARRHDGARRDRPGRRRQRPGHLPVPDRRRLPRRARST